MKVSIIIATWNKNEYLPNTLYSLARQRASFPFEICIIDDHSNVDPKPIIDKYLPGIKYKRLSKHVGFMYSQGKCLDLVDPHSDVILIQSDDIIYTRPDSVDLICKGVKPGIISLAEVVDIPIKTDITKQFDIEVANIVSNWTSHIKNEKLSIDGIVYNINTKYSGSGRKSHLFFCGAIARKDLDSLGFRKINCDAIIGPKINGHQYLKHYPMVKVIHQRHPKKVYHCPIVSSCKYHCIRKTDHIGKA